MNRQWYPATLRWLTPKEGGRVQPPSGPEYRTTARFFGTEPADLFSVIIRPSVGGNANEVEIALLAPEQFAISERMNQQAELVITEGPRPVAECRLLPVMTAA